MPGPPQLSRARGPPPGRQRSMRPLPSDDLATWARQVEAELARVHTRLDDFFAELSATTSSSHEIAAACADQVANSDFILRQFVENNSGRVACRDDGDAQERQRLKAQLSTEMATWNNVNTARKLSIIRGHIPLNLGNSSADLQSFVGETIHVTANVASQLRSFSSYDIGAYGPRLDGPIGHSLMVADRLDLLTLAVVAIRSVGLSRDRRRSPVSGAGQRPWRRVYGGGHGLACAHLQQLQYAVRPRSACRVV